MDITKEILKKIKYNWNTFTKKQKAYIAYILIASNLITGITAASIDDLSKLFSNENKETDSYIEYVIKPGDTLSEIAVLNNMPIEELIRINKIDNPNAIEVGEKLKIAKPKVVENYEDIDSNDWDELDGSNRKFVKGIDISLFQNDMDLGKVIKQNDINFVMIRSAYFWQFDSIDSDFANQAIESIENGAKVGTYFWPTLRNIKQSKKELEIVTNKLDELRKNNNVYLQMPICLDIEHRKDGGGDLVERIKREDKDTIASLKYTIKELEKNYYVMIYCSDSVAVEIGSILQKHGINIDLWLAKYYTNESVNYSDDNAVVNTLNYNGVSTMRQYTQNGRLKGYANGVDCNLCYKNLPAIIKESNLNYSDEKNAKKLYR